MAHAGNAKHVMETKDYVLCHQPAACDKVHQVLKLSLRQRPAVRGSEWQVGRSALLLGCISYSWPRCVAYECSISGNPILHTTYYQGALLSFQVIISKTFHGQLRQHLLEMRNGHL